MVVIKNDQEAALTKEKRSFLKTPTFGGNSSYLVHVKIADKNRISTLLRGGSDEIAAAPNADQSAKKGTTEAANFTNITKAVTKSSRALIFFVTHV